MSPEMRVVRSSWLMIDGCDIASASITNMIKFVSLVTLAWWVVEYIRSSFALVSLEILWSFRNEFYITTDTLYVCNSTIIQQDNHFSTRSTHPYTSGALCICPILRHQGCLRDAQDMEATSASQFRREWSGVNTKLPNTHINLSRQL